MSGYPRQRDPRVKVEWANERIEDLNLRINTFIAGGAYEIVPDLDPQTSQQFSRVDFKIPIDTDIPCLIGDILHNLRAALDQLIYRIMPPGPTVRWTRQHGFPVNGNANQYRSRSAVKIQGLPADLVQRIDLLEPYQAGKGHSIWQLHELNIIDKHRLLLTVGLAYHQVWRTRPYDLTNIGLWPTQLRSRTVILENGTSLPAPLATQVNRGEEPPLTIAFDEPAIIHIKPAVQALVEFADLVERVIAVFDDV